MIGKGLLDLLQELELIENESIFYANIQDGPIFVFPIELQKKVERIAPDAFFVFNDLPFILFFDLSGQQDDAREQEIHKMVWSFDNSPLAFIIKGKDVQIFNAFSYNRKTEKLQEIKTTPDDRKKLFSFWNLQSGATWKWLHETQYAKTNIQRKRVNQKLFENIKNVRERLTNGEKSETLIEDDANILILRLIFIRYLIDRDVKIDNEYIKGISISERRKSFAGLILEPQKLKLFFNFLNDKFNGVLFKNTEINLSSNHAIFLSWVLTAKSDPAQPDLFDNSDFYFDVFDFSIIPVEVISGIYESLINPETRKLHSAVYTPAFLVEHILSQTLDVHLRQDEKTEFKILDPSCGSGIFLVQAYRRMVDNEKKLKGKLSKPRLREIAERNLYGIDINEQALKVSCFSIYIAILDYQDPKTILDNFKFPALIGNNLFEADFFDQNPQHPINKSLKRISFDFILGNPPWKKDSSKKHLEWVNSTGIYSRKITGGIEIAQSFLLRSREFMKDETISALIVTSMVFYNVSSTTREFKANFLNSICLNGFFDLSPVRKLVFEEKISPASVVYYRITKEAEHLKTIVKHQSLKSNIFLKYFNALVIEKSDQKDIPQRYFIENDWMFKVALYGGTLDYALLKKLEKVGNTIYDLFDNRTIFKGAGIHNGTKEKYSYFPIEGKPLIENEEVQKYYSFANVLRIVKKEDSYIKSGREEGLYQGLQILIKEQAKLESELVISLTDKSYVYRSGVFSLSSVTCKEQLEYLFTLLITNLYEYYVFITSGSWGVSTRPQIRLDEEFLRFPFISADTETQNELLLLLKNFLTSFYEHHSTFNLGLPDINKKILSEINNIVLKIYNISGYEKDLIDYALDISRYQFQESKQLIVSSKVECRVSYLERYIEVIVDEFKKIYQDEYIQAEFYALDYFIAVNFKFQREKPKSYLIRGNETDEKKVLLKLSQSLSISAITNSTVKENNIFIQKDLKGFENNAFYIVKPNEAKCWHRAVAWYDLAEIKQAIEQAELEYLNR